MTLAFNEGMIKRTRTRKNTTSARSEDFVGEWARAYKE